MLWCLIPFFFMGVEWVGGSEKGPLAFLDYFGANIVPFGVRGHNSQNETLGAFLEYFGANPHTFCAKGDRSNEITPLTFLDCFGLNPIPF
jgi:hypothetical protein